VTSMVTGGLRGVDIVYSCYGYGWGAGSASG